MKGIKYPQVEPLTFAGVEQNWKKSGVAVIGVPYSSTTYWDSNTKYGPSALIDASRRMELYDLELKGVTADKVGIYTLPELAVSKASSQKNGELITDAISQILQADKFPLMLGGEHSITFGAVRAVHKKYPKLSVLQIDAHTDLRDEFEGTKYHHGTVMRRIQDLEIRIVQVGIRSVSQEEIEYIEKTSKKNIFLAPNYPLDKITKELSQNVYISFDLDGLDPAIMPSTGTPEPGGLNWYQALDILRAVCKERNIVGADIVELAPKPGLQAPDFLAAKLAYKLIGYSQLLR